MIIGVSGKSGSGKSSVAKYLANELGFTLLDLDVISKKIREDYKSEILELVRDNILNKDDIDSKKLGKILFENPSLMEKYNLFIYGKQKEVIAKYEGKNIIIDSIFLPIMEIFENLDVGVLVYCDEKVRMERVMKRDNITKEYFLLRDKNGLNYNKEDFDYVIYNDNDYIEQLNELLDKIKK